MAMINKVGESSGIAIANPNLFQCASNSKICIFTHLSGPLVIGCLHLSHWAMGPQFQVVFTYPSVPPVKSCLLIPVRLQLLHRCLHSSKWSLAPRCLTQQRASSCKVSPIIPVCLQLRGVFTHFGVPLVTKCLH